MKDLPSTQLESLQKFASDAKMIGLRYTYINGKDGIDSENTYCYNCGVLVIERFGSEVNKINLIGDRCPQCGFKIDVMRE